MRSTGITAIAYNRFRSHLGLEKGVTRVYDLVQQPAEPEIRLLDRPASDAGKRLAPAIQRRPSGSSKRFWYSAIAPFSTAGMATGPPATSDS